MELQELEKLLDKYEAAETSLEEEQKLRSYFSSSNTDIPATLAPYKMLFSFTEKEHNVSYQEKPAGASRKKFYVWSGIAASIVLALGLFVFQENSIQSNDKALAVNDQDIEKTLKTFEMVSEIVQDGREDLIYLKEFSNTTNKFIKDN